MLHRVGSNFETLYFKSKKTNKQHRMETLINRYGRRNITKQNTVRCSIQKRFSAYCNYSQVVQKITCLVTIEKMAGAPCRTVQFWYSAFRT